MKRLSWIITLPITVVVVVFSIANSHEIAIDLWPFEASLALPLFVLVLVSLLVGFLVGACVMWITAGKTRSRARAAAHKASDLEREVASLKRQQAGAPAKTSVPAAHKGT